MITDKPTPEQLVTFLKGLSDDELDELLVTRAHHNNTVPIEFVSKSTGTCCGIDNSGYQVAVQERANRSKALFEELGLTPNPVIPMVGGINPLTLLRDHHEITFGGRDGVTDKPWRSTTPTPILLGVGMDFPFSFVQEDQFSAREHARRLSSSPFRQLSSTERFEKFVKDLPLNELLEVGDLIVNNPVVRGLGGYHSMALKQSETVYHTDLPLIYGEIKSRFKQMGVVK